MISTLFFVLKPLYYLYIRIYNSSRSLGTKLPYNRISFANFAEHVHRVWWNS